MKDTPGYIQNLRREISEMSGEQLDQMTADAMSSDRAVDAMAKDVEEQPERWDAMS